MPKLLCVDAVPTYNEISLADLPIVFGRSLDADVRFDDTWTSRFHCQLELVDRRFMVRDLGSSNGTLINGDAVSEGELKHGDRLTVGISTFELSVPARLRLAEQPEEAVTV
ncbi:MAG: hypothetical protein CMJ78_04800 [Planctomycetaceae bacterium]|nr:hypothetical protein [Planctomycetaceae bacterium]